MVKTAKFREETNVKPVAVNATPDPHKLAESIQETLNPQAVVACRDSEALLHLIDPAANDYNAGQQGNHAVRITARMNYPGKVVLTFEWKEGTSKCRGVGTIELMVAKEWAKAKIAKADAAARQQDARAHNLLAVINAAQPLTA